MGQVGNVTASTAHLAKELDGGKPDYQNRSFHRKYSEEKDPGRGVESRKGEENGEDRPGGSEEKDVERSGEPVDQKGKEPSQGSGEEVVEKKLVTTDPLFDLSSEEEEPEHIEENV